MKSGFAGVVAFALSLCGTAFGQPFTSLETYFVFSNAKGSYPFARLVEGPDGSLYGTTHLGGLTTCSRPVGCGTVFRITPDGRRTILHAFNGANGSFPDHASLTFGADGNLYGVARFGGTLGSAKDPSSGQGTVFRITTGGVLTTLHVFAGGFDGGSPAEGLTRSADGTLYGTSTNGGAGACRFASCGTIFKIATDGTFSTVHQFSFDEGWNPTGMLTIGTDGNIYGLTRLGGTGGCAVAGREIGCGTVFRMTPDGAVTTIYTFGPVDGELPEPRDLLFDPSDNSLIGMMRGSVGCENPHPLAGCGTLFRLTLDGTLTTTYVFTNPAGDASAISLVLSSDGNIYGLGLRPGCTSPSGCHVVFRLTPGGEWTVLHEFGLGPDGVPISGLSLIQSASGDLLGTAEGGPKCSDPRWWCGAIFRVGLFDTADAPNLRVRSFEAPNKVAVGATLTITDTTANRGAAPADAFEASYWLSSTQSLAGASEIAANAVPSIPAGGVFKQSTAVTLPPVGPGVYHLIMRADDGDVVHETYEADNTKRRPLLIGPDLQIRQIFPWGPGLSIDPSAPASTEPTDVTVYTANLGGDVVGPSTTYLYASATGAIDAGAVLLTTIENGVMKPHEHNHVIVSLTLSAGTYFLIARADATGAIGEAIEDNNLRKLKITVR